MNTLINLPLFNIISFKKKFICISCRIHQDYYRDEHFLFKISQTYSDLKHSIYFKSYLYDRCRCWYAVCKIEAGKGVPFRYYSHRLEFCTQQSALYLQNYKQKSKSFENLALIYDLTCLSYRKYFHAFIIFIQSLETLSLKAFYIVSF